MTYFLDIISIINIPGKYKFNFEDFVEVKRNIEENIKTTMEFNTIKDLKFNIQYKDILKLNYDLNNTYTKKSEITKNIENNFIQNIKKYKSLEYELGKDEFLINFEIKRYIQYKNNYTISFSLNLNTRFIQKKDVNNFLENNNFTQESIILLKSYFDVKIKQNFIIEKIEYNYISIFCEYRWDGSIPHAGCCEYYEIDYSKRIITCFFHIKIENNNRNYNMIVDFDLNNNMFIIRYRSMDECFKIEHSEYISCNGFKTIKNKKESKEYFTFEPSLKEILKMIETN